MGRAAAHAAGRRGADRGDHWLHEIKYDDYRMHARPDRAAIKLLTRTGLDWTTNIRRLPKPWQRSRRATRISGPGC